MFVSTLQRNLLARAAAPPLAALLLLLPPTQGPAAAQSGRAGASPKYAETPGNLTPFSGERAYEHVKKLVGFGPRPSGSKALEEARRYIIEQLPGSAEASDEQAPRPALSTKYKGDEHRGPRRREPAGREDTWVADTPVGKLRMTNIVFELPGRSEDTIIIAGHYDTKRFKEFDFVGANDGGSSAAALIELARALAASKEPRRFGYRFVFFDGEEAVCRDWDECGKPGSPDNTYGSRHYLARLRARDELKHVRALILLDMVGYERLELGRDTMSTPWLVDLIWETARELGYGRQFVPRPESVGGDDHEPFLRAGVPSADLIQLSSYPHWHTPADTLDKISPASLKAVGDVVIKSLPRLEERLSGKANP